MKNVPPKVTQSVAERRRRGGLKIARNGWRGATAGTSTSGGNGASGAPSERSALASIFANAASDSNQWPLDSSHRGDSGRKRHASNANKIGIPPIMNMMRQPSVSLTLGIKSRAKSGERK